MSYNPFFYKHANSEDQINAKKKLYKANNISILFLLTVGFCVAFFSKDIVVIFFDKRYLDSYKIIPIIVLGYFFIQLISLQNLSFYHNCNNEYKYCSSYYQYWIKLFSYFKIWLIWCSSSNSFNTVCVLYNYLCIFTKVLLYTL